MSLSWAGAVLTGVLVFGLIGLLALDAARIERHSRKPKRRRK